MFKIKMPKINLKKIFSSMLSFWARNSNWIFIFSLVVFLAVGVYIWYKNVYKFQWSEERKAEYINSRNRNIDLQEEKFKSVLAEIEKRQINLNVGERKAEVSVESQDILKNDTEEKPKNTGPTGTVPARKTSPTATTQPSVTTESEIVNNKNSAKFNPIKDIFKGY